MVVTGVVACGLFASRGSALEVALLGLALWKPLAAGVVAVAAVAIGIKHQRRAGSEEAVYLQAVALELRAGASLRAAIESAAHRTPGLDLEGPVRLARVGAPMADIAGALGARLPRYGVIAGSAIHTAGLTGGRVAGIFDSLAQIASEDRDLARERRAATAQARISAWIVGGIPIVFLAFGFASGRLGSVLRSGVGVGIITVGLALVAAGSGTVVYMLRRSLA